MKVLVYYHNIGNLPSEQGKELADRGAAIIKDILPTHRLIVMPIRDGQTRIEVLEV